jgi:DNA-binding transcriptional LysR family regulator
VSLTDAGEAFLEQVRPALATIADAGRTVLDAQAEPRGLLRVTATASMAETVGAILLELVERHPQIRLELDFSDRQVDLVAEGYDVAVRPGARGLDADCTPARPRLGRVLREPGVPQAPRTPEAAARPDAARLRRVLRLHARGVLALPAEEAHGGDHGQEAHRRERAVGRAASRACRSGHRVDTWWVRERGRRARPVLESFWPPPVPVQLLYPTSRHLAPQVRAAVELLMDRFTV